MPYEPQLECPRLFDDIEKLGASRKTIARLTDLQENVLTRGLNGTRTIPWPEFKSIRGVVDDLLVIKDRLQGVPIDWSNVPALRKLLADLHAERSAPATPLSNEESQILARFLSETDFPQMAIDMGTSREALLDRIKKLLMRSSKFAAKQFATA